MPLGYLYDWMCAQSNVLAFRISPGESEAVDGRLTRPNDEQIPASSIVTSLEFKKRGTWNVPLVVSSTKDDVCVIILGQALAVINVGAGPV